MNRRLTAIVEREGDGYVSLCPELQPISIRGRSFHALLQRIEKINM